jgi:hypothetical protein
MEPNSVLDEILVMLRSIKDNPEQLEKLHQYMLDELHLKEEENEAIKVPQRYTALVKDVADSLSAGLVCYINRATLEKIEIPQSIVDTIMFEDEEDDEENEEEDDEENEEEDEDKKDDMNDENPFYADLKRINRDWEQRITINPPESHVSFSFMERFVDSLPENHLRKILAKALSGRKPFSHFNNIIHQSDKREAWFAFRQKYLENYVTEILAEKLWKNESGD